jgi:hypothetical protein
VPRDVLACNLSAMAVKVLLAHTTRHRRQHILVRGFTPMVGSLKPAQQQVALEVGENETTELG